MRWLSFLFLTTCAVAANAPYEAFTTEYPPVYAIAGFDTLSRLEVFRPFDGERKDFSFTRPDGLYTIAWEQPTARIVIGKAGGETLVIPLDPVVQKVETYLKTHPGLSARAIPQEALTWEQTGAGLHARLYFDDLSLRRENGALTLYHFKADVLLKSSETGTKR